MSNLIGRWIGLRGAFRALIAQSRIDNAHVIGVGLLLQGALVGSNQLFQLDLMFILHRHSFSEEEFALDNQIHVLRGITLAINHLVSNRRYFSKMVLQACQPFRWPCLEESERLQKGINVSLLLQLYLHHETLIVIFDQSH